MASFQWQITVLDDELEIRGDIGQAVRALKEAGLRIVSAATADEFLTVASMIAQSDIALVDVKWMWFDTATGVWDLAQVDLANEKEMTSPNAWVRAIAYWFKESKVESTALVSETDERWPKAPIFEAQVGIWLGACLSHLSPEIKILLWSGSSQISLAGDFAALGAFKRAAFRVVNKDPRGPLGRLEVWIVLESLQEQALRRPDLYEWFLSHVLVPILLDLSPIEKLSVPSPTAKEGEPVDLKPELFFPQLKVGAPVGVFFPGAQETTPWKGRYLSRFLHDHDDVLGHWQRVYLDATRHLLRRLLSRAIGSGEREAATEIARARATCIYAGYVGKTIADRLEALEIRAASENLPGSELARGLQESLKQLEDLFEPGEPSLERLCAEFEGKLTYMCDSDVDRKGMQLPFGLLDARAAAVVLRDNALGHKCAAGRMRLAAKIETKARTGQEVLELEWTDESEGFATYESFCSAVHRSISVKGSSRGLALPVLLGIRNRSLQTEVFIVGFKKWVVLGGPGRCEGERRSIGFGMRWRFSYGSVALFAESM